MEGGPVKEGQTCFMIKRKIGSSSEYSKRLWEFVMIMFVHIYVYWAQEDCIFFLLPAEAVYSNVE